MMLTVVYANLCILNKSPKAFQIFKHSHTIDQFTLDAPAPIQPWRKKEKIPVVVSAIFASPYQG